jgi:hypothetical protein
MRTDQSRSSFISLDDVNSGQNNLQNQAQEQQLHNYIYFEGNLTDGENNDNTDIGSSHEITCNYLNSNYNHNEVEQEADRDEPRPFTDALQNCFDSEEGEELLVCNSSADMGSMTPLNSAFHDQSAKCSLGLGFSSF